MSEEEKKAIETLKEVASDNFDTLGDDISPKMAQNILNVIDKLKDNLYEEQEQNEYLKDKVDKQQKEIEELKKWHDVFLEMYIHKDKVGANYISKDKIREIRDKAEVMDYYSLNDVIDDLSKLIGDYEEDE